jgi:hypothetical protein
MTDQLETAHEAQIDAKILDRVYRRCWMMNLPIRSEAEELLEAIRFCGWEPGWTRGLQLDRPVGRRDPIEERLRRFREGPPPVTPHVVKGPGPEWDRVLNESPGGGAFTVAVDGPKDTP